MSTSGSATWALIDETRNTANNGYGYKIVTALDASNNGWNTTPVSLETVTGVNSQRILNSVAPRAKVTIYGAGGGGAGGSGGVMPSGLPGDHATTPGGGGGGGGSTNGSCEGVLEWTEATSGAGGNGGDALMIIEWWL